MYYSASVASKPPVSESTLAQPKECRLMGCRTGWEIRTADGETRENGFFTRTASYSDAHSSVRATVPQSAPGRCLPDMLGCQPGGTARPPNPAWPAARGASGQISGPLSPAAIAVGRHLCCRSAVLSLHSCFKLFLMTQIAHEHVLTFYRHGTDKTKVPFDLHPPP